jgi:hypothetical protein
LHEVGGAALGTARVANVRFVGVGLSAEYVLEPCRFVIGHWYKLSHDDSTERFAEERDDIDHEPVNDARRVPRQRISGDLVVVIGAYDADRSLIAIDNPRRAAAPVASTALKAAENLTSAESMAGKAPSAEMIFSDFACLVPPRETVLSVSEDKP